MFQIDPTMLVLPAILAATALALRMRQRRLVEQVCFDGRGAYGAEWEEYRIVDDDDLIEECARVERQVPADK